MLNVIFGLFLSTAFAQGYIEGRVVRNVDSFTNYVKNPDALKNLSDVTASGGSLTRNTTTPLFGVADFAIDASASDQTYTWALNTLDSGLSGQNCEFKGVFSGDASLYKAQIVATSTVVSEITLSNVSVGTPFSINAACSGVTSVRFISTSASAAAIKVESIYFGKATNIGNTAQASIIGMARWPGVASCSWQRTANNTFADYAADADCTNPSGTNLSGTAQAPATKIPAVTIPNVSARKYKISVSGQFINLTAGTANCGFAISDGTTLSNTNTVVGPQFTASPVVIGYFEYSSFQGSKTFSIQSTGIGGSVNCTIGNDATLNGLQFIVEEFPSQSEQVVSNSQTVDLLGSLLFVPSATCPQGMAKADGGSTAGFPQYAARYGATFPNMSGLFPRASGSQTISGVVHTAGALQTAVNDQTQSHRHNLRDSAGLFAYGGGAGGWSNGSGFQTDLSTIVSTAPVTDGANGTPRTGTTTYPANMAWTACVAVESNPFSNTRNSVVTDSFGIEKIVRVRVGPACTSSPCTITDQSGGVTSVTRASTGNYTVNFASGIFSSTPSCTLMLSGISFPASTVAAESATAFNFLTFNTTNGVAADTGFRVLCQGPR